MKNRTKLLGMLVVGVLALGQAGQIHAADANPPERVTYQGFLVDGNGAALAPTVPANYDVVFRIYNVKQGGSTDNILWAEQQTVTVDKGYFSVLLGEGSASANGDPTGDLSDVFDGGDASDRFIGVTVKGLGATDLEIAPRLQFVASPFTFLAAYARQADKIVGTGGDVLTTDGGNIGIGNASPNSKLDVGGDIKASGAVDVGGNANVQGQLAVGTSSAPTAALDVTGAIKASSGLDIDGDSTIDGSLNLRPTGTSSALRINASSIYSDYQLKLWNTDAGTFIRNDSASRKMFLGANNQNTLTLTPDGKVGINASSPGATLHVGGTIKAKAYDMTVLTYEHPQTTPISDWGTALLLEGVPYQKINLDYASDTLAGMDRKFKINNPDGAICDFKFIWSVSGDGFIIAHLIVTTDADGSNNQIKLLAKGIQGGPYPSLSLNQSVKLGQGTHRVVVKYRNGTNMNLTPAYDYGMLKLQVKVNGDADAVGSGWVTEKL